MTLLLLGFSNIARRRALPAAVAAGFKGVEVCSQGKTLDPSELEGVTKIYSNYDAALRDSNADVVYVTTVNSLHAILTEKALEHGFHVIVDKPAFLSETDVSRLVKLAQKQGKCLAEALVWQYHPRIQMAVQAFDDAGSRPTRIVSTFSFPPLPPSDFRYKPELGGGALWDLGPYAVSPARIFFGEHVNYITGVCTSMRGDVEDSFSILAGGKHGESLVGSFGYNTGYLNRLEVLGPGMSVTLDRVFSPPADLVTDLTIRDGDGTRTIQVPAADTFQLFFERFQRSVEQGKIDAFTDVMQEDARALYHLRKTMILSAGN